MGCLTILLVAVVFAVSVTSKYRPTRVLGYYSFFENFTVADVFPTCADIVDVWPPPNSVLKPLRVNSLHEVHVIRVTFSRSIVVKNYTKPYFTLSVSTIQPLMFLPYYYRYSYGSEKSFWVYFRIPHSMTYLQ